MCVRVCVCLEQDEVPYIRAHFQPAVAPWTLCFALVPHSPRSRGCLMSVWITVRSLGPRVFVSRPSAGQDSLTGCGHRLIFAHAMPHTLHHRACGQLHLQDHASTTYSPLDERLCLFAALLTHFWPSMASQEVTEKKLRKLQEQSEQLFVGLPLGLSELYAIMDRWSQILNVVSVILFLVVKPENLLSAY